MFQNEWLFNTEPKAFLKLVLTSLFLSQCKSKEKKIFKKIARLRTSQKSTFTKQETKCVRNLTKYTEQQVRFQKEKDDFQKNINRSLKVHILDRKSVV